jgi:hypothetical protein
MSEPLIETTAGELPQAQAAAAPAPQATIVPNELAPTTIGGGKNVVMPQAALTSRLRAAADKGKRAAMDEVESQAKASGFTSLQDMFSTVAALKQGGAAKNAPSRTVEPEADVTNAGTAKDGKPSFKEQRRYEAAIERERKGHEAERKLRLGEERKRKEAERQREAIEAEMSIREVAIMAGVKDVDYSVALLRRSIQGKSPEELKSFDEHAFFENLREKQPYLFGEVVHHVTTGTGKSAPPAPAPGTAVTGAAQNGQIDAKKMSAEQFREHLRKRGLSMDAQGV